MEAPPSPHDTAQTLPPGFLDVDTFDVVVLGTGLIESIVAAAAARVGRSVVHLDRNDYYGSGCLTLPLVPFRTWLESLPEEASAAAAGPSASVVERIEGASLPDPCPLDKTHSFRRFHLPLTSTEFGSRVILDTPRPELPEDDEDGTWWPSLARTNRSFNLDSDAHLFLARGSLVDLLIQSGVGKYLEFRPLGAAFQLCENILARVPCSKGDVFQHRVISLVEKRLLMRFLNFCLEDQETRAPILEEYLDRPFVDFLTSRKLTPQLQLFILHAIAFIEQEQLTVPSGDEQQISTADGMKRLEVYLSSLGRYGPTAFLCLDYGMSELPQAFCRLCAVWGGIYILRRSVESLLLNTETGSLEGVLDTEGQVLRSQHLVTTADYVAPLCDTLDGISRCVCITDASLEDGLGLLLTTIPPSNERHPYIIHVIQLDHTVTACPEGQYVLHLFTRQRIDARMDLSRALEVLLAARHPSPRVLWMAYFNQALRCAKTGTEIPCGVHIVSNIPAAVDASKAVEEARHIFHDMFPDDEFLPPVADEELIAQLEEEAQAYAAMAIGEEHTDPEAEIETAGTDPAE